MRLFEIWILISQNLETKKFFKTSSKNARNFKENNQVHYKILKKSCWASKKIKGAMFL